MRISLKGVVMVSSTHYRLPIANIKRIIGELLG